MEGKTSTGFAFDVNENELKATLTDFDFLELMARSESGDDIPAAVGVVKAIAETMRGDDPLSALKEHVRENGHAPIDKMIKEVDEIVSLVSAESTQEKN